jgi:hypothetical protein
MSTILGNTKFQDLDNTFHDHIGQYFFDYIKRPSSNDDSRESAPPTPTGVPRIPTMRTGLNITGIKKIINPYNKTRDQLSEGSAVEGGSRRSHKPSQKKTSKGKSRSRSRSRSKTRSKSKSKSKTRAKSKSKRR